jgi:surfactin family lipopeptide synthetase A
MESGRTYVAARNETERVLVGIWQEILGKDQIGVYDDFFELGGDSIKILRMAGMLNKTIQFQVPLIALYQNSNIAQLLLFLTENKKTIQTKNKNQTEKEILVIDKINTLKEAIFRSDSSLDRENIEDIYPMSSIEKGMVFEYMYNLGTGIYHDQFVYQRTFSNFNIERFTHAITLLVEKHPILRTCFNLTDYDTEVHLIYKQLHFIIPYQDITHLTYEQQKKEIQFFLDSQLLLPFEISKGPLWRMNVFGLTEHITAFVFQFHHAILDGWANAAFMTELNNLYLSLAEMPKLKPKPLLYSYKDFIVQNEVIKGDESVKHFWSNELTDCSKLDILKNNEDKLAFHSLILDATHLAKIERTAINLHSTVKVISLTAYLLMLRYLSGTDDILTGLVTNIRPSIEDSEKVLGCFLNTLPLRMMVNDDEKCRDLISRVNSKLILLKSVDAFGLNEISQIGN